MAQKHKTDRASSFDRRSRAREARPSIAVNYLPTHLDHGWRDLPLTRMTDAQLRQVFTELELLAALNAAVRH